MKSDRLDEGREQGAGARPGRANSDARTNSLLRIRVVYYADAGYLFPMKVDRGWLHFIG